MIANIDKALRLYNKNDEIRLICQHQLIDSIEHYLPHVA